MISITNRKITGLFLASLLLVAGCSGKTSEPVVQKDPDIALSCIGVLPVQTTVEFDRAVSKAEANKLKEGGRVLGHLIQQQLSDTENIRYISADKIAGIETSSKGNGLERAREIGSRVSCNALLETTISKYSDRVGSEYSVDKPAAVAFEYTLYELDKGRVLCQGQFDEVQKSVMENLYNWNRASGRGFKWVAAEQLLREGLKAKFSKCSYLMDE